GGARGGPSGRPGEGAIRSPRWAPSYAKIADGPPRRVPWGRRWVGFVARRQSTQRGSPGAQADREGAGLLAGAGRGDDERDGEEAVAGLPTSLAASAAFLRASSSFFSRVRRCASLI